MMEIELAWMVFGIVTGLAVIAVAAYGLRP